MATLSHAEAKRFYDRFASKQDNQAFYEDCAIEKLIAHAGLDRARSVLEFGCGTGRLALRLLDRELQAEASYLGVDVSETMIGLARERLAPFRERAELRLSDGSVALPASDGSTDRVVSTYVADLLPDSEIGLLLDEASRVLRPQGRLCLTGITPGSDLPRRVVSAAWSWIHALNPAIVGGCRPVRIAPRLDGRDWRILHSSVVHAWGISSEVLVAEPPA